MEQSIAMKSAAQKGSAKDAINFQLGLKTLKWQRRRKVPGVVGTRISPSTMTDLLTSE